MINALFPESSTLESGALHALLSATHGDPFSILGPHRSGIRTVLRVFRPDAREVRLLSRDLPEPLSLSQTHSDGLFEILLEQPPEQLRYQLELTFHNAAQAVQEDPYRFGRQLGSFDTHLFAEGQHWTLYERLGAHLTVVEEIAGCCFRVWAPNARRVSVVGDFNHWDGRVHPMRKLMECGIWEIFIPGIGEGAHYKFEVLNAQGHLVLKSDPFAFFSQNGLQTASLVFNLDRFQWHDTEWMERRAQRETHKEPVSIYEVHLGSWRRKPEESNRPLSYHELAEELIPYVKQMGYTHIELMPVAEHPFEGSWGYQVTGFFSPTSRHGNPDDFRAFVNKAHQEGIGIILDWVPGHFPKDLHGLAQFDGTCLYEHSDPRQGEHNDWGTLIFNYGRNEVRNFLIANALFWLDQYHIDGLRVDAVASMLYLDYSRKEGEWIPNQHGGRENLEAIYFLKRFNEVCYERFPGIMTIAEESTAWPGVSRPTYLGGLGFGLKWNMGWMHDFLLYMSREPIFRRYHQGDITFSLLYAFHEHFVLVLSHDEVVHGKGSLLRKMPGDLWQKFANLRMFYAWMYAHPGKKLLFMGGEFGQWSEWNHNQSLDWHLLQNANHDGLSRLVQHLNWLYRNEPALYDQDDSFAGFQWIDFHDADNSVVAFQRISSSGDLIVFAVNATPVPRENYRIGVSDAGFYEEILNTDAQTYGGSNLGNFGGVWAEETPWQGRGRSLLLRLPPLALIGLRWRRPQAPAHDSACSTREQISCHAD
ncbi:MAG: glycogen branching enzyme [Verrucomicrobiota bacterium]|jgi:1,4-alpha-glucan branching enzyme